MKARRFIGAAASVIIAGLLGGCWGGSSGGSGELNEGCRNSVFGANPCDPGLVCDSGTCRSCGAPGERCCSFRTCDGANECRVIDGEPICGDCGEVGEACCPSDLWDSCAEGVLCNTDTNVCEAAMTDPCVGSTPRTYWGRWSNGCSHPDTLFAVVSVDDESTAEQCARAILGAPEVRDEPPELYDTCERMRFFVCEDQQRWAFSEEDAESCAQASCGADCEVEVNECPPSGGICE